MMRLRHAPASPFVRKVMVALHETGLIDQVTLEDGTTSPLDPSPGNIEVNPTGKIPCLVREDGLAIYDSRVITRYLASLAPEAGLYPEGDALWPVLTLEATADAMMDAAVLAVYERRLREAPQISESWIAAQQGKVARALDMLEERRPSEEPHMGHLAIACALGYLDFRFPDWDWRAGRPRLAAWAKRIHRRPSLEKTAPA
ncbi:MAG: glutathione S-transferase family protein [Pseudomonadota bacterium]